MLSLTPMHPAVSDLTPYQLAFVHELCAVNVEFLVIGGMALRAHGLNRQTRDIDLFVSRSCVNAEKLSPILASWLPHLAQKLSPQILMLPDKLIGLPVSLPKEKTEIDIFTSIGALNFDLCFGYRHESYFSAIPLPVLGLLELLYSKLFSVQRTEDPAARARDLADIADIAALWQKRHNPAVNPDAAR